MIKKSYLAICTLAGLGILGFMAPASADVIDVQFGASGPNASSRFAGAAVIGSAGDQWNDFQSGSGNGALATSDGAASGVSISFSAEGAYGIVPGDSAFADTPYASLMQAFLYHNGGAEVSVTFSGLAAGEQFSLFLYSQSDVVSQSNYGGIFTVNGASETAYNDATSSTFVDGVNYLAFTGVADSRGDITLASATAPGRDQVILNGIQLDVAPVSVPEPVSLSLLAFGVAGVIAARRRTAQA